MKWLILIICLCWPVLAVAQNFEDSFSDGNFSINPSWSGADSNFVVFDLEGNNVLRLNDNEASTSYLSTPSFNIVGEWEFFVRLDFSPSNNNFTQIFLMSDRADLSGEVNGYALRWGENLAGDVFRLFRMTNGVQDREVLSGTTNVSSGGEYRIKVSRDNSGNWALEAAEEYLGSMVQEAIGNDNTYTSASFFGIKATYTSGNVNDFYFDFKIDEPPVIIEPLFVNEFLRLNTTELDISFNRDINVSSVQTSDFELNGSTNPQSFLSEENDALRITFQNSFPTGQTNTLLISGISSATNDTVLNDTTLSFVLFDEFEVGDVLINEFLKDPPTGSGLPEYIELKNATSKYLNLKSWKVGDNNTLNTISDEDIVLLPHSFLVITSNPEALITTFGEGNYIDVSLPALNNSTDQIRVFNASGINVDSLEYDLGWGGENVALERRSLEAGAIFRANWGDSPSPDFGTPGKENLIEKDNEAPFLESALLVDNETITLQFNEELKAEPALDLRNYSNNSGKIFETIMFLSDVIEIKISPALNDGEPIEMIIRSQEDIFGNKKDTTGVAKLTYLEIVPALKNEVVINEIMYRRKDELSPEFVELYNTTEKTFDLLGWSFKDASSSSSSIPEGTFLSSGEYLVLTDREDFASSFPNAIYLSSFPSLNDSGDQIIIKNADGITIDSVFYQSTWGGDVSGVSVERKDPLRASNDGSNWGSNTSQSGFSGGGQNTVFEDDVTSPEIIFASENDTSTFVAFSEFIQLTAQTVFRINDIEGEVLTFDPDQANHIYIEKDGIIEAVPKYKASSSLEIEIKNLTDTRGNVSSSSTSLVSLPLSKGDVVINEILFNPLANNEDNLPDQTEYIELYNRSLFAISLEGISLHDTPDEDNEIRSLFPVSSQYKWIEPKGYFLIYSEDETASFSESKIAQYFSMEDESDQFTMQVDRSSLSLAASDDAIYLADINDNTIDSVFYNESWQNPNLFDTDGIAIERIDPAGASNNESNWSSSTHVSGGTPNLKNSIFQEAGALPESLGISFMPNPFSPDDDGFEDHLFINYTLNAPDYLLRVRIFDRYGREVRKLADGLQTGFKGSLIWDGLTDDKKKNRVGIYIVLFEAYNSANGSNQTFKETVVLARMF